MYGTIHQRDKSLWPGNIFALDFHRAIFTILLCKWSLHPLVNVLCPYLTQDIYIWMQSICGAWMPLVNIYIPFINLPLQLLFVICQSTWMANYKFIFVITSLIKCTYIWITDIAVKNLRLLELTLLDNALYKFKLPSSNSISCK